MNFSLILNRYLDRMDSDNDELNPEEDGSEAQLPSTASEHSDLPAQSISSSSDSLSEETHTEQLLANTRQLKAELQVQFRQDWLNRLQSREQNPKIELNLLLHDIIRKETLTDDTLPSNDNRTNAEIFQVNRS